MATINGLVVGFAQACVRGDIWFLSQLFVHPEVHARGIGQELLRLAMEYGRDAGCETFSVVSSTSPVAQSLYMRAGMFGIGIGYRLVGSVESLLDLPTAGCNRRRRSRTAAGGRIGLPIWTGLCSAQNGGKNTPAMSTTAIGRGQRLVRADPWERVAGLRLRDGGRIHRAGGRI